MQTITKCYSPLPGNGDDVDPKHKTQEDEKNVEAESFLTGNKSEDQERHTKHKGFRAALREALQEWSNDDARDIEEDDSTPLRSGL